MSVTLVDLFPHRHNTNIPPKTWTHNHWKLLDSTRGIGRVQYQTLLQLMHLYTLVKIIRTSWSGLVCRTCIALGDIIPEIAGTDYSRLSWVVGCIMRRQLSLVEVAALDGFNTAADTNNKED
jgi:hypothetical protein